MHDFDRFERRLAAALRTDADRSVGPFEAGRIARAAIVGARPARRFGRGRGVTLLAATALLLVGGALAAGSGVLRLPSVVPPVPAPSFGVVATASPQATSPSPSELASTSPRPSTAAALIWTQASLNEDWPAPVRTEPAGPPTVVPFLPEWTVPYVDPTGDTGSDVLPWVDITDVTGPCHYCLSLRLVAEGPADVDPTEQWIAYGIVADTDRDGVPDWRYGTDNTPVGTPGTRGWPRRWWRTDLHTGRTEMYLGDNIVLPSGTMFYGGPGRFSFGGAVTGGGRINDRPGRFYAWASVIQDGRVVATDYAPDAGWFVQSPNVKP